MLMLISIITTREESRLLGQDYNERYRRLVGLARTYLHNLTEAQDAVQDVFERIADHPNGFMSAARSSDAQAMGYLRHCVRTHCIDLLKKKKKQKECLVASDDPWLEQKTRVPEDWDGVDTRMVIVSALEQMSPGHRAIMVLRFHDGYSYQEIGRLTGQPVTTVTNRIHRIRAKLQKEVLGHATVS